MPAHRTTSKLLKVGTRGSTLALIQTRLVERALHRKLQSVKLKRVVIKTTGDCFSKRPLAHAGRLGAYVGKGLFVKEIEESLLRGDVDIAVHSLKDVPIDIPSGLVVAAYLKRETPFDLFVSARYKKFKDVPRGGCVGTSSPRRAAYARRVRPDLRVVPFRGNVGTRLEKLAKGFCDGAFFAEAGLKRLGLLGKRGFRFERLRDMVPSAGQGIICVETRASDAGLIEAIRRALNDPCSEKEAVTERAFVREIGGDCHTPIAANATANKRGILLRCEASSQDGGRTIVSTRCGRGALRLGRAVGKCFVRRGARKIIQLKDVPGKPRKIIFTSLSGTFDALKTICTNEGFDVVSAPLIRIVGPSDGYRSLDAAIRDIDKYHWIIFTSKSAVRVFIKRMGMKPLPKGLKTAAVGSATAKEMLNKKIRVDLFPESAGSKYLAQLFNGCPMRGRRVLFPRAQEGLDILPRALEKMGALVDVVSAYRTVPNKVSIKKIGRAFGKNGSHSIVFASRSAEDVFDRLFGKKVKNRAFVLRPL